MQCYTFINSCHVSVWNAIHIRRHQTGRNRGPPVQLRQSPDQAGGVFYVRPFQSILLRFSSLSRSLLFTVPALVGVGVGLPSLSLTVSTLLSVIGLATRVPTKPLLFLPVRPLPSQLSFNSFVSSSIFPCASSPLCTDASTLTHCSIRPTVSVTCAELESDGRAAGGELNDSNATS
jgi:hypothetical protein